MTVLSPFLRHLNTGTLAFVMFVAFALLSSIRGKESEVRELASAKATKAEVVIDNFSFSPKTFTAAVGATVTWINHDDVPHTATSTAKPKSFQSGTLDTDGQFAHVFTAPGTYDYFCAVHPKMTGKIIVK